MFEDSMLESGGRIKTKSTYWMIATFSFWAVVLAVLILIPLLYPDALPKSTLAASLTAPPPPPPPAAIKPIPVVSEIDQGLHAPTKIPKDIKMIKEDAAPPPSSAGVAGMTGMGSGSSNGVFGGMGLSTNAPKINVAPPKPTGPQRISGGVMAGSLINKVQPAYPPIAKAAHVGGTVMLHAIISKTGTITSLQAVSGPDMLKGAALDAVRQWRYKPYLLNGEPTEVDTTITVNFNLNGG